MEPSNREIEHRVVADHIALRGLMARVEKIAGEISRGERNLVGALRIEGEALHDALRTHNEWENRTLLRRLRSAGPLGEQRARYLEEDHGAQLEMFERTLESLETQDLPAVSLAREMLTLVEQLRDDLSDEEEMVLDDKVWNAVGSDRSGPEGDR